MGENFIIIYRLSMLDLVEGGSSFDEVIQLAKEIEKQAQQLSIQVLDGMRHVFLQSQPKFLVLHLLG